MYLLMVYVHTTYVSIYFVTGTVVPLMTGDLPLSGDCSFSSSSASRITSVFRLYCLAKKRRKPLPGSFPIYDIIVLQLHTYTTQPSPSQDPERSVSLLECDFVSPHYLSTKRSYEVGLRRGAFMLHSKFTLGAYISI